MVDVEPEDITNLAPEFADVDEDTIDFYIEAARDFVNEARFGTKAKRAIMYMTLHLMTRAGLGDSGAGGQGAVIMEKVGDITTQYAQPVAGINDSALGLTRWGELFELLKTTLVRTPLVT